MSFHVNCPLSRQSIRNVFLDSENSNIKILECRLLPLQVMNSLWKQEPGAGEKTKSKIAPNG